LSTELKESNYPTLAEADARDRLITGIGDCVSVSVYALHSKRKMTKQLELSTPNLVRIYSLAVAWHALTQRSKGQGQAIIKTVMVTWLLVKCAAVAVCRCCQRGTACHMTTQVSSFTGSYQSQQKQD